MKEVGIRELKAKASEIVRRVAEHHATYTVTCRGRPVGVLAPATLESSHSTQDDAHAWERLEELAAQIGGNRLKRRSALRELAEMRR